MVKVVDKKDLLREVNIAAMHAFDLSGGGRRMYNLEEHRRAIVALVHVQERARKYGATESEIADASNWGQ